MRVVKVIFTILLALAGQTVHSQRRVNYDPKDDERRSSVKTAVGTIEGSVVGADGIPERWVISFVNGAGQNFQVISKEKGEFKLYVPPGVYTARVQSESDLIDKSAKLPTFVVRANSTTRLEVDPTYEISYCTSSGEKAVPIVTSGGDNEQLKGLRRPYYDTYPLRGPDGIWLDLVVQSCGKTQVGNLIKYKSALFIYDANVISVEKATFDPSRLRLEGKDGYYWHGGQGKPMPRILAEFTGGKVSVKPKGEAVSFSKRNGKR